MNINAARKTLSLATLMIALVAAGCSSEPEQLVIYAGKGLRPAVEEIKTKYEVQENVSLFIVYAGSQTLLKSIQETQKGDVFIPGSPSYIKQAGELITHSSDVALHVPTVAVSDKSVTRVRNYKDLRKPGLRIAVGNSEMAAIGRITDAILKGSPSELDFSENIVVSASTVNELLALVVGGEVDAAIVWKDMLLWKEAKDVRGLKIPLEINLPKEIRVSILSTSTSPRLARHFADYVSSEGKDIFKKHGFGQ